MWDASRGIIASACYVRCEEEIPSVEITAHASLSIESAGVSQPKFPFPETIRGRAVSLILETALALSKAFFEGL